MTTQKDYVDYKNAGDIGTDATTSIQPIGAGEAVTQNALRRPSENLRTRTEIARSTLEDLLYYRNRAQYVMQCTGTGVLSWAGTIALGGTGILNNSTQLTLRPMLTPRANIKGLLAIGTTTVNAVRYEVQATAYETDGMNAVTVEHRDVTGTVAVTCTISDGPIKRILVVFDSTNVGHNSLVTVTAVNAAIGLDTDLNGKILAVDDGVPGNAILTMAETPIDVRTHSVGTAGNATMDVEEHTLAANALSAFTTLNPLQEGDLLAVRYDYLVEPIGGDPNDPKGGAAGGRAESNASRANTNIAANLFIAQDQPEWLPGAIPLCKIVNNVARWIDGTNVQAGFPAVPGSALGSAVNTSNFQGPPTLAVGGGLLTTDTTPQAALDTADDRLGQLRAATWHITDNATSFGGHYNAAGGLLSAMASATAGGHLYLRRGTYTGPAAPLAVSAMLIEGEYRDGSVWSFGTITGISGAPLTLRNMTLARTAGVFMTFVDTAFEDVTYDTGLVVMSGSSASMKNCTMNAVSQVALPTGTVINANTFRADNCSFIGPDGLTVGGSVLSLQTRNAEFRDCTFTLSGTSTLAVFTGAVTDRRVVRFTNCTFNSASSTYMLDFPPFMGGTNYDVVFDGCVFTNSAASQFLIARQGSGVRVQFVNGCRFVQNNTTAPTARMIDVRPTPTGEVLFDDLTVIVGEGVTAGVATFPLVSLGWDWPGSISAPGHVASKSLRVEYASSATGLHTHNTVKLSQSLSTLAARPNIFQGVSVDCNGKRSLLGTEAIVSASSAEGTSRLLEVQDLSLINVDYPNGGSQSIFYGSVAAVTGLNIVPVNAPAASSFPVDAVTFSHCEVLRANIPRFRAVGTSVGFSGLGLGRRVLVNDVYIGQVINGNVATAADVYFTNVRASEVRFAQIAGVTNAGSLFPAYTIFRGCSFIYDDGRQQILDLTIYLDLHFTDCEFAIDNVTGNNILGNTANVGATGYIVSDNRFYNVNATVPSLPGPAPAGSYAEGNLFYGGVPL